MSPILLSQPGWAAFCYFDDSPKVAAVKLDVEEQLDYSIKDVGIISLTGFRYEHDN